MRVFPENLLAAAKNGLQMPEIQTKNRKSAFAVLRGSIIYLFFVLFVV